MTEFNLRYHSPKVSVPCIFFLRLNTYHLFSPLNTHHFFPLNTYPTATVTVTCAKLCLFLLTCPALTCIRVSAPPPPDDSSSLAEISNSDRGGRWRRISTTEDLKYKLLLIYNIRTADLPAEDERRRTLAKISIQHVPIPCTNRCLRQCSTISQKIHLILKSIQK